MGPFCVVHQKNEPVVSRPSGVLGIVPQHWRRLAMNNKPTLKALARTIARKSGAAGMLRFLRGGGQIGAWERVHPFDVAHGTDTSGFLEVANLGQLENEQARVHAVAYAGSQPSVVRAALTALPPLDTFSFVDLGCGKGRPLLVASEFPFRHIVGVELSVSLAETARRNAALVGRRYPERTPVDITTGDASRFALPPGNLVVFLYNPFGDEVIGKVVEAVETAIAASPCTVFVVYYNPVFGHRFDASRSLSRYFAKTIPYAASELGYGPDSDDPVVIWQGGVKSAPTYPNADLRIDVINPPHRVQLVPA